MRPWLSFRSVSYPNKFAGILDCGRKQYSRTSRSITNICLLGRGDRTLGYNSAVPQGRASDMKLVIYPAVEIERLNQIVSAAGGMSIVNAQDEVGAEQAVVDADAFFGKMTPRILSAARQLRWVQSPTAGLEQYMFPELIEHPCVLTNMRGLYSDVIAEHVFGYVICFARNFHRYIRKQTVPRWEPIGSEPKESLVTGDPGLTDTVDQSHIHLVGATLGIVGLGHIGSRDRPARRAVWHACSGSGSPRSSM